MLCGQLGWVRLALATFATFTLLASGLTGCGRASAAVNLAPTATRLPHATQTPTVTPIVAAPTCAARQLTLTATHDGAASGHIATLYQFTNVSMTACSLRGYPGARLLDAHGQPLPITVEQVAQAYLWNTTPVKTINLAAGGSAWFRAQTSDMTIQSGVTCPVAARTIIAAPGVAAAFTSSIDLSTCDGKIYLSPLVADPNAL